MAILQQNQLAGVNEVLEMSNIARRVATLDTGGDSLAAQAEVLLDRARRDVLLEGYKDTVQYGVSYAPDGSDEIVLASSVLWIRGSGAFKDRNLTTREDKVYDLDKGGTAVFTEAAVTLDTITLIDFEDIAPRLKNLIVARAAMEMVMQMKPNDTRRIDWISKTIAQRERSAGATIYGEGPINATIPETQFLGGQQQGQRPGG